MMNFYFLRGRIYWVIKKSGLLIVFINVIKILNSEVVVFQLNYSKRYNLKVIVENCWKVSLYSITRNKTGRRKMSDDKCEVMLWKQLNWSIDKHQNTESK